MADITKCFNKECPLADKCYRATAKPNYYRQSYNTFKFTVVNGVVKCDYFMKPM